MARVSRLAFLIVVCVCASLGAWAAEIAFPPLTGRVVDQAAVLSAAAKAELEELLAAHERATGQQVVVATVSSLQGQEIEEYGYRLGRTWGIGQKDKNTGAILLVAPNERAVRIEVGYGLEGTLTDAVSRTIIETQIVPPFRAGQMEVGIRQGVRALLGLLAGDPNAMPLPVAKRDTGELPPIGLIIAFFIIMLLLRSRRRRRGWAPFILGGPGIWQSGGRRGGFSGGGLGGFGGGGGFRGGGGSFGGGGASGRW